MSESYNTFEKMDLEMLRYVREYLLEKMLEFRCICKMLLCQRRTGKLHIY